MKCPLNHIRFGRKCFLLSGWHKKSWTTKKQVIQYPLDSFYVVFFTTIYFLIHSLPQKNHSLPTFEVGKTLTVRERERRRARKGKGKIVVDKKEGKRDNNRF